MLGGGGGLGQTLVTAMPAAAVGASGGGVGATLAAAVPGMIGALSKTATNRMAKSEINALDDLVRSRSPLGAQSGGPRQVYDPSLSSESLQRALLMQSLSNPQMPMDINMQNALGAK